MIAYNKNILFKYLIYGWIILFLVIIFSAIMLFAINYYNPNVIKHLFNLIINNMAVAPNTKPGWNAFVEILKNNEVAGFWLILIGLIPIPGLYWLVVIGMGSMLGVILTLSCIKTNFLTAVLEFGIGIMPHGIFEFSAMFLIIGLSSQINNHIYWFIYKRLRQDKRKEKFNWKIILFQYLIISVSLIVIAALIESFITPLI
ncbi:stage II sporulation protein M [Bombilactobacillus bombi]|uniref:stage II sporulation protein M n=1 Tax=Bombilactobacillus bombi TaxID=1303590 RepID=UPI0015E5C4FD|nr:stage II sporulation protein M [Bombilactobacillus bombi]MBA1433868.1 stage II sporulation protein M [Bombilactobacillus bombi]